MTRSKQNNPYRDHNLKSKAVWEDTFGMSFVEILKNLNWRDLGFDNNKFGRFICTDCGGRVSMAELDFCNFEVEQALCKECQKKPANWYYMRQARERRQFETLKNNPGNV